MRRPWALLALSGAALVTVGCDKLGGRKASDDPPPPPTIASATETVPPAASFNATPVAQFADAGNVDGKTPLEQARFYRASGQLWLARLHIEQKALGEDATKEETELLLEICMAQPDAACVEKCGTKLGRKIKFDAGAPVPITSSNAVDAGEHREPDTDLAHARDLVLKMQLDPARKVLEPKVLDGKATREEIRMLRTICQKQSDRMCVALCDSKLK